MPKVKVAPKPIVHNSKFPIVKTSRTNMVNLIEGAKGRFFTATHIDTNGKPRTMNVIRKKGATTELGYLIVKSIGDKGYRNINPRTLTDLSINGTHYVAPKPRAIK